MHTIIIHNFYVIPLKGGCHPLDSFLLLLSGVQMLWTAIADHVDGPCATTICTTRRKEAEFLSHGAAILALSFLARVVVHERGEEYISVS